MTLFKYNMECFFNLIVVCPQIFFFYLLLETVFPNNTLQKKVPSGADINYVLPKDMPPQQAVMLLLLPDVHNIPPYIKQPLENHIRNLKSKYPGSGTSYQ